CQPQAANFRRYPTMRTRLLTSLLLCLPLVASAQDKPTPGNEPIKIVKIERKDPVAYENDIEPIFVKKCAFCHSGNVKEARLDMGNYEGLMKGGKRGKSII